MNRRDLLKLAALGGARAVLGPAIAAAQDLAPPSPPGPINIERATIADLQTAMTSGRATAVSVARQFLDRIQSIDKTGPALNSIIELNPDALALARELDAERGAKGPRGPLHGVPVLVKDNLDTRDRMATTAGSLALVGSRPARDSFVVRRLRDAGAVLLGKTNLSEWANFRSSKSTSAWSGRGGLTKHPYFLDRNPSGSSSGSAVAVAAGLCAAAVGTETDGSVISPASVCGVVGIKPTVGLVSRAGIIPISRSQDTAGPIARTVRDAAVLLGAMAGFDPRDPVTEQRPGDLPADYTQFLDAGGLKGARIGIPRRYTRVAGRTKDVFEATVRTLKDLGATVIDPADPPDNEGLGDAEFQVLLYEFKAGLNAYLESLGPEAPVRSLAAVIAFNERNAEKEMPYFGQEVFLEAEKKGPLTEQKYLDALEKCRRLSRAEGIDAAMEAHRLDALVAPSAGPAVATDLVYGDRDLGGSTSPAAVAGYPSITVPAGDVLGLPVGVSFFGRAYSEPTLLRLAYAFEQATKARKPPRFLPTIN